MVRAGIGARKRSVGRRMLQHRGSVGVEWVPGAPQLRCCGAKRLRGLLSTQRRAGIVRASSKDTDEPTWSLNDLTTAAVPALAYATMLGYAAKFAPDQTPLRDMYFIVKLVGLGVDDGVPLNTILSSIFFLMGIYPIIFGSLMIPSARSKKVWHDAPA